MVKLSYHIPSHRNSILFFKWAAAGGVECRRYCAVVGPRGARQLADTCGGWKTLCTNCHATPREAEAAFTEAATKREDTACSNTHARPGCSNCVKKWWWPFGGKAWKLGELAMLPEAESLPADTRFTDIHCKWFDDGLMQTIVSRLSDISDSRYTYVCSYKRGRLRIVDTNGKRYRYTRQKAIGQGSIMNRLLYTREGGKPPTLPQHLVFGACISGGDSLSCNECSRNMDNEKLAFDLLEYGVDTLMQSYQLVGSWEVDEDDWRDPPACQKVYIAYEKWDGSLEALPASDKKPGQWEKAVIEAILPQLLRMYKKGLLYWDVKAENILYRERDGTYQYTLGDLGSVQRIGSGLPAYSAGVTPIAKKSNLPGGDFVEPGITTNVLIQALTVLFSGTVVKAYGKLIRDARECIEELPVNAFLDSFTRDEYVELLQKAAAAKKFGLPPEEARVAAAYVELLKTEATAERDWLPSHLSIEQYVIKKFEDPLA
jgi:hypothetical protein